MKVVNKAAEEDEEFDLTAMIDIVFLLLIYFMVTTTLVVQEADMGIQLPADVQVTEAQTFPLEVLVDILPSGEILMNGESMDRSNSRDIPQFYQRLVLLRRATENSGTPLFVSIQPRNDAPHQRSMDVLNALAKAQVKAISFSMNED